MSISDKIKELESIINKMRIVKLGDLVLSDDHNNLVYSIQKIKEILESIQIGVTVDAKVVEESYANYFKLLNLYASGLYPRAEILYNQGILTIDDIAKYASILPDDYVSWHFQGFSISFASNLLNSSYFSIHKGAKALYLMDTTKAFEIFKHSNLSANRAQSILYEMVDKGYWLFLIDLFTEGAVSFRVTRDQTVELTTGVNRYYSITIEKYGRLYQKSPPALFITRDFNIFGDFYNDWIKANGGSAGASGAGAGGYGCGGLIILAKRISGEGLVECVSRWGNDASTVTSSGNGGDGEPGLLWEVEGYPAGMGGKGGGPEGGSGTKNGGGGGGYGYRGGSGGIADVVSFSSLTALLNELFKCATDWWLVNIVGKTPTTIKQIPILGGSGGGGGGAYDGYCAGGGGGGGGTEMIIFADTINGLGRGLIIDNYAGDGGYGGEEGSYDCGGGGGGGGLVYVGYKTSFFNTYCWVIAGGGYYGDYDGENGSAGSILIDKVL